MFSIALSNYFALDFVVFLVGRLPFEDFAFVAAIGLPPFHFAELPL